MFSLRFLFALVAFAGLACAALINRTQLWGSILIAVTVATAVGATIAAWQSPSSRRFYAPTAGVIWMWLLMLFYAPLQELERQCIVSQLVFEAWPSLIKGPISQTPAEYWEERFFTFPRNKLQNMGSWPSYLRLYSFYHTVHGIAAVFFGALAGTLTVLATRRRNGKRRENP